MNDPTFGHTVVDNNEGYIPFNVAPIEPAKVALKVTEDGSFWLNANAQGYLHLAKIFVELGLRKLEPGYHLHTDSNFKNDPIAAKFNFGLLSE